MAVSIGFRISRLPHLWRAVLDRRLAPLGLTQTRWVTLYHLWQLGEGHPQCDLARVIGVEAPSLVRTLGQLEEQGLVERRASDVDRRSKCIYLTATAMPLLEQIDAVVKDVRNEMFSGLTDSDIDQLDKWLAQIETNGLAMQSREQESPSEP